MTLEEGCRIAYNLLGRGFTEIRDLGDCWYFWGYPPDVVPLGPQPFIVFKESGEWTDWMDFTFVMKRSDKGPQIAIPPEFVYHR